jgi:GTP-binding protein Era
MSLDQNVTAKPYRAGFIALVGQPNAGKSTLLNLLLKEKVSIVTDKPQTTRSRVTGILNLDRAQAVFVDAPGFLKSSSGINKFLQEEANYVITKTDVVCGLLAADDTETAAEDLIALLQKGTAPWVIFVTKADILGQGTRTPRFFNYLLENKIPFVSISPLKREEEAREEVLSRVIPLLPESPGPLFSDEELYTTQTVRQMAAEFIREACFENLRQEIPYGLAVMIEEFNEEDPMLTRVRARLLVEKQNHKGIVIGSGGQMLKKIGTEARTALEKILQGKVFLELHVEVREGWTSNPRILKELGYVVPKNRT